MKLKESTTVHKELRLSYYEQKRERLLGFLGVPPQAKSGGW